MFITFTSMSGDLSSAAISSGDCALCKSVLPCSSNGKFGSAPPASRGAISCGDLACVWSGVWPAYKVEGRVGVAARVNSVYV